MFVCECLSLFSVLLFDPRAAIVEQAEARFAVPITDSADRDSGLLQHFVQRGFLNGCWRDALLVRQRLQLPVRRGQKKTKKPLNVSIFLHLYNYKAQKQHKHSKCRIMKVIL